MERRSDYAAFATRTLLTINDRQSPIVDATRQYFDTMVKKTCTCVYIDHATGGKETLKVTEILYVHR